jgi:hypothetical protein
MVVDHVVSVAKRPFIRVFAAISNKVIIARTANQHVALAGEALDRTVFSIHAAKHRRRGVEGRFLPGRSVAELDLLKLGISIGIPVLYRQAFSAFADHKNKIVACPGYLCLRRIDAFSDLQYAGLIMITLTDSMVVDYVVAVAELPDIRVFPGAANDLVCSFAGNEGVVACPA